MNKILIIGLGLIGGSFAKAVRKQKIAREIWAFDTDIETINLAKKSKIIDGFALITNNLDDFDLVVIATPLAFYKDILTKISATNPKNTTIIDLGSLQEFIFKILPQNLRHNFIACHPIAGSDKIGFENSSAELFMGKKFIICKEKFTAEKSLKIVENIVNKIGAKPDFIDAKPHDEIYALVSHLPQFLSFLTKEFSPEKLENNFLQNAFRLDNSSPSIWEDIFKLNQKNLEKFYFEFFDNLSEFKDKFEQKKYSLILSELKTLSSQYFQAPNSVEFGKIGNFEKTIESKLIFRLIIVASYLKITKIKSLQNYAGTGFKDFTSLIFILESNCDFLKIIENNQKDILSFIKKIS